MYKIKVLITIILRRVKTKLSDNIMFSNGICLILTVPGIWFACVIITKSLEIKNNDLNSALSGQITTNQ